MATNEVLLVTLRNDVAGMALYLRDFVPNTSLRSSILDAEGQSHYLTYSLDFPGATILEGDAYCSGSLNTSPIADAAADDTTGGGNDVLATPSATYGLAGYLRERVHPGGITTATAGRMSAANAVLQAAAISAAAGGALTLSVINDILAAGSGGTANTDLDGSSGNSKSFGSVEDILRILAGVTYKTPVNTIICNVANQFRSESERDALVAAQDTATTGKTFVSRGYFVGPGEPGYRHFHTYIRTGAVDLSVTSGFVSVLKTGLTYKNPNFAYTAGTVDAFHPRAYSLDGSALPPTGTAPVVAVYTLAGEVL